MGATDAASRSLMYCCRHDHYALTPEGDRGFEIDATRVRFGRGLLDETGQAAKALGMRRVAFVVDQIVARLPAADTVRRALREAGLDVAEYPEVEIEPSDASFRRAAAFALESRVDGFVSLGGGSTIDTAKAANLFATHPADFMDYVNAPIGAGKPIPGPLRPHVACPTTSGTGAECTGIAVFDYVEKNVKTGLVGRQLKPSMGIVDPDVADTLPPEVVACSGFDVLSHALESFTALPYTQRKRPANGAERPSSQGANPYSDIACLEALRILGEYMVPAVMDADRTAREKMMFAATLAGIGFGNAGNHAPHGMSYSVSGLVRDYRSSGYPQDEALVPHGMSVIVNAPAAFRFTAEACPERHLAAARALGAKPGDATPDEAGDVLAARIVELMRATRMPNGLTALGYTPADARPLAAGAFPQRRLLANSPRDIALEQLEDIYRAAMTYW
jgi:alcohol dehydrogenase class IV